jgi:DNA-binding Xre family transcriptional regulator
VTTTDEVWADDDWPPERVEAVNARVAAKIKRDRERAIAAAAAAPPSTRPRRRRQERRNLSAATRGRLSEAAWKRHHHPARGSALRRLRGERGIRLADLAAAAGVSLKTAQRLESGQPVLPSTVADVASALGVRPSDLA